MLSGRFDHAIDEKGRVSVPARFREILVRDRVNKLFITNGFHDAQRFLELYTPAEWERLLGRLRQKNPYEPSVRMFQMVVIGGAHEVQVDKQGRILIPPNLREFANLGREVTFNAMINLFQLWNKEALSKFLADAVMDPKFLQDLNL